MCKPKRAKSVSCSQLRGSPQGTICLSSVSRWPLCILPDFWVCWAVLYVTLCWKRAIVSMLKRQHDSQGNLVGFFLWWLKDEKAWLRVNMSLHVHGFLSHGISISSVRSTNTNAWWTAGAKLNKEGGVLTSDICMSNFRTMLVRLVY